MSISMSKDVEEQLNALHEMISEAFTMPLGNDKVVLNKDRVLAMLDDIMASLPGYVKEAKRIAEEENQIRAKAKREAESIVRAAEEQARKMTGEQEVLNVAKQKAAELMQNAEVKSKEVRRATNEYVDNLLKRTEEAINAAMTEVKQSRAEFRLAAKK